MNSSVKEILYKLENDRANIEVKISEEKGRQAQPLEFEEVKKFITMFTKKDYSDIYERNEFFCRFIKKVIMFNDKMIIIYNGNFNPASEVSIDNNEAFEKQIIEKLKQKKDCPSDNPLNFNEKIPLMTQSVLMGLDGGELGIRTPGSFHYNGFQDRRFRPLSQLSINIKLYSFFNGYLHIILEFWKKIKFIFNIF